MMQMAEAVAQRSTCSRLNVGAVISRQGRPISTGYNGNVSGMAHCEHDPFESVMSYAGEVVRKTTETGCQTAMHAEANAIAFAARHGVATEDAHLYVTHQPCLPCARLIVNAGIEIVYYDHPYRISDGLLLLQLAGVDVFRLNPEALTYDRVRI